MRLRPKARRQRKAGVIIMERHAWKGRLFPGKLSEYIKRHNEIWPEMEEMLAQAGIRNYSIWNMDDELFGYYECDSVEHALQFQATSDISKRWRDYMSDVMEMCKSPETGETLQLINVFCFQCNNKER